MYDQTERPAFGGGAVFMAALRLLRHHALALIGFAALANLALALLSTGVSLALTGTASGPGGLLEYIFGPLIFALLVLRSSDALAGAQRPLGEQLRQVLAQAWPLIALSLAASLITAFGLLLLVVPGLYAAAVLLPLTPVILFERAGWEGLARSYALARPYAWPIVGVVLRMTLVGLVVLIPLILLMLPETAGGGGLLVLLLSVLGGAALVALYAVAGYMIYLRLRELRDGGVSDVFR
ncbi:hypothetical protein GE300_05490 [Rhodobacteraceae bacterium 2CG4]|uniref:Glycerophosphoryl diester phosphodiesterase membrane domain-containing protein n=1 Tax=Halovulum marinum TaxID=2662447 RepID=A0A6L5YYU2_9RHOB|nr:hypothetical protein [Halovulum marinum]MSU89080.1 hypothetical protein [Halovulum marinum]